MPASRTLAVYDQILLHRADLLLNAGDVVRQDPHLTTDNGQCPERRLAVDSQILFTLSCSLCSHRSSPSRASSRPCSASWLGPSQPLTDCATHRDRPVSEIRAIPSY